jgi:hypothetical protein
VLPYGVVAGRPSAARGGEEKMLNFFRKNVKTFQKLLTNIFHENVSENVLKKMLYPTFSLSKCRWNSFQQTVGSTFYEKRWFNFLFEKCCNILKKYSSIL